MIFSKITLGSNYIPAVINTEYDTGLTLTVTTKANEKIYTNAMLYTLHNNTPTPGMLAALYTLYIDATPVFKRQTRNESQNYNASYVDLAYVSDALSAGSHTVKITIKWTTDHHQPTLLATSGATFMNVIQYRG